MEPEMILAYLMELRDCTSLERYVSKLLMEHDWEYMVELIRKAKSLKELLPDEKNPLREGVINDGFINLLRLNELYGLDVNYLEAFSDLKGATLDDLRAEAWEQAKSLLRDQLKRGTTFFVDVEAMQQNVDLLPFVPDVLNARIREVQSLESHPPLSDVYSTYYGFSIITSGGVMVHRSGVPSDLRDTIMEALGEIGTITRVTTRQLKYSPLAFRGCSPYLKMLLWNLLRFCIGGYKSRIQSVKRLAEMGDVRALLIIESAINKYPSGKPVEHGSSLLYLLTCVGKISSERLSYYTEAYFHVYVNRFPALRKIVFQRTAMQKLARSALL
jgi:hypothetical protein